MNAQAGGLLLVQEKYLAGLVESGLNQNIISKKTIFLAIYVYTHNGEEGLLHGAIDLQMDPSYLESACGLHH